MFPTWTADSCLEFRGFGKRQEHVKVLVGTQMAAFELLDCWLFILQRREVIWLRLFRKPLEEPGLQYSAVPAPESSMMATALGRTLANCCLSSFSVALGSDSLTPSCPPPGHVPCHPVSEQVSHFLLALPTPSAFLCILPWRRLGTSDYDWMTS